MKSSSKRISYQVIQEKPR